MNWLRLRKFGKLFRRFQDLPISRPNPRRRCSMLEALEGRDLPAALSLQSFPVPLPGNDSRLTAAAVGAGLDNTTASLTSATPSAAAGPAAVTAAGTSSLSDVQRSALEQVVRDSTNQIRVRRECGAVPPRRATAFARRSARCSYTATTCSSIALQKDAASGAEGQTGHRHPVHGFQ